MRIPEVNCIHPESFQALLTGNGHIIGVAAEAETFWQPDAAKFGSDEDVLAFLWIQCQPLADDHLGIALTEVHQSSVSSHRTKFSHAWWGSHIKVATVPKGTSHFVRVVKQSETLRIRDRSDCSRARESNAHRSKADA